MRKKVLAVVVALVAAQLLSGCYMLREFSWDKDKLGKGDKATADIGLVGLKGKPIEPGRFFLLAEVGQEVSYEGAKFDTTGELGDPQKLQRDDALEALAIEESSCQVEAPPRRQGPGAVFVLYRTKHIQPETSKLVRATLEAKASNSSKGGGIFGSIQTGGWVDDGDGIPEDSGSSDDDIGCWGIVTTQLGKKGPVAP